MLIHKGSQEIIIKIYEDFMIYKNLKLLRCKKGVSQKQLTEEIGCHRNSVWLWESGTVEPDDNNLQKLANYYGVDKDDLSEKTIELVFT